jgi:phosphate transport system substrate-binding protein
MKTSLKAIVAAAAVASVAAGAATAEAQTRQGIRIVGSSTVYPFTKSVAERFAVTNKGASTPIVESNGTGGGAKLFCAGLGAAHPDILDASRRLKASEFRTCAANGVTAISEIQVGLDGIALASSKAGPLRNVRLRDIYEAIAANPYGKPNRAKTWKDVNPALPAIPIQVYGPPSTSGTRSSIEDLFMEPACAANSAMQALKKSNESEFNRTCKMIRTDGAYIDSGENDNLIVRKLAANPNALGLFGYSYLEENLNKLKGVSVDGVQPTYQTISAFKYPGARALYIYVKNAHVKAIPGMRAFVSEYVKETTFGPNGYLKAHGLVASPATARQRSARIAAALTPMSGAGLK